MSIVQTYTAGITACSNGLPENKKEEISLLAFSAKLMTMECGIRFLTDYLQGDVYFKIHRPGHNLDRSRTQMCLVADMEKKLPQMEAIVERCR